MKDFLGNELAVDDNVVLIAPNYRHFVVARVIAFTPANVRVEFNNTWNFGPTGYITKILQAPGQLIKVTK